MSGTLRYILDTDTCIYLLNGNQQIKEHIVLVGVEAIAVTIVTKGELYFGAYNSGRVEQNLERIETFLAAPGPPVLPLDERAVNLFGKFKAELRQIGQPIGDIDLLIASIAVSQKLKLVTNNTKHFKRIPGIVLENWASL